MQPLLRFRKCFFVFLFLLLFSLIFFSFNNKFTATQRSDNLCSVLGNLQKECVAL
ncbi:hypothetical protein HanRHA438_Chr16g0772291 [Helianthus annuus]|nr:hypothetical protein HanRHA438_Chr16g0772291 [Helianthus annuus]